MSGHVTGHVAACNRNAAWILSNDKLIYMENTHKLVWKQYVSFDESLLLPFNVSDAWTPSWIQCMFPYCALYVIESVVPKQLDRQYSIICGKLLLNSKISWGITKKNLKRYTFVPLFGSYPNYIVASKLKPSQEDVYVRVEILPWESTEPIGHLVEVLGPLSDTTVFDNVLLNSYQLFPRDRNKFHQKCSVSDVSKRHIDEDWRSQPTVSVDPDGSLDIDDALSINDSFEVAVHIASPDEYAFAKYQQLTVYSPSKTHHLLPLDISTNQASLLSGHDRYCISVIWSSKDNARICRTLIHNDENLSYDNCIQSKRFCTIQNIVKKMFHIEHQIDSHDLIELLMVKANCFVAQYISNKVNSSPLRKTINRCAFYLPHNPLENNVHAIINDMYTHFTSPIRRAFDQHIHRLLHQIINHSATQEFSISDYVHMNCMKQRHKLYYSKLEWLKYKSNIPRIFHAHLQYIHDAYVHLEIPEYGLYASLRIIPYELENDMNITMIDDTFKVSYKEKSISVDIHSIQVEVHWITSMGIEGLKCKWIHPNISNLVN